MPVHKLGRANVHRRRGHFRHMLAALPCILRVRISYSVDIVVVVCAARLSRFLLAGNVEQHGQPVDLLLDEPQVSPLLPGSDVLLSPVAPQLHSKIAGRVPAAALDVD